MAFPEKLKLTVKRKAHFACCLCHSLGVEVHHIVPQEEDGPDSEDNAAPLCPSCHEIYGANPLKRKFIREARDFWYEMCAQRYASDPDRLSKIESMVQQTATKDDLMTAFERFKEEVLAKTAEGQEIPRSETEILEAVEELFDKVWYDRHQLLRDLVESGRHEVHPDIWKGALKAAETVETRYGKDALGPWTDFDWGMLNGKLSALRWVLGDDWDMLDT